MTPNEMLQFIDSQGMLAYDDASIRQVDYMVDHDHIYLQIGSSAVMLFRRHHNRTIISIWNVRVSPTKQQTQVCAGAASNRYTAISY